MAEKSKILVLGATGATGRHIVWASLKAGHPTFALIRKTIDPTPKPRLVEAANPENKDELILNFKKSGVTLLEGDMTDRESLTEAIKQVDIVICATTRAQILYQINVIEAIKDAGNKIKRFFPSEFGLDVDRHRAVDPVKTVFAEKARIRRLIEKAGIPYTYLCCHGYTGYFLRNLQQLDTTIPPRDKVYILGDGNVKGAYVTEADVGTYTIRAADDPRTLNKAFHIRLPSNYLTFNDVVSLWEKKIGKTLDRIYVPEEKVLKDIQGYSFPNNYLLALYHSSQINGDTIYDIDPSKDVDAYELYPDVKYTTVDEYFEQFV